MFDEFARAAKALASGRRIELLDVLANGERTVEALAGEVGLSVANTSQHLQVLRQAWFRPAYVPGGYRFAVDKEWPMERLGPPLPAAQSFRTRRGNGQVTVGINPDLRQLDVEREVRTYPTVRVVPVRGRSGLLFPRRPGNFYAGLTWEERPGLVVQVIAR